MMCLIDKNLLSLVFFRLHPDLGSVKALVRKNININKRWLKDLNIIKRIKNSHPIT